ncbi:hypothetical protein B0H17DRAFT_1210792 [Mycena rosella]|uniref:Uncharacterized protein n=1 Tax=Mycena rosella TaxID=1033263 RepID=A0AAD7G702_MYCRO|nr:hypothetical protein B0H17DRAFT_1210792 [Mycena rosella]
MLQIALASLYPTHPTADTVFDAGTDVVLKWIDTSHHPRLTEMGSLKIDLRTKDDVRLFREPTFESNEYLQIFVINLATGVSAMTRTHTVPIPHNLTHPGPYVILFTSIHPPTETWTADFGITPVITDSVLPYIPQLDDTNATNPRFTIVLPTTTIVSELAGTVQYQAATTITAGPLPAGGGAGTGLNRVHSPSGATPGKDGRFRNPRFGLVFVAWPALVGISMAL